MIVQPRAQPPPLLSTAGLSHRQRRAMHTGARQAGLALHRCSRDVCCPPPPSEVVRDVGRRAQTDGHPGCAQGVATAPKADTMFPNRELIDGAERLLERDRIYQLLVEAHPELEDRITVDDASPMLKIGRASCRERV